MKTKRQVLKSIAKFCWCKGIPCVDCPYEDKDNGECRLEMYSREKLARFGAMAILRMFPEKKKPILKDVLRNETLIKSWQQNMIELLEKNECLEKETVRLKKLLKNYQEQAICNGFCKNCKHIDNKTLCKECGINNYLWELAE